MVLLRGTYLATADILTVDQLNYMAVQLLYHWNKEHFNVCKNHFLSFLSFNHHFNFLPFSLSN